MTTVKHPLALSTTFIWVGFVCAISFMEAWLKFRAPGVTTELGLGIGRIVFGTLNKVELVLCTTIFLDLIGVKNRKWDNYFLLYALPLALLIVQTFWLLPALDARATLRISSEIVPPSNLHFYYVGFEIIKVIALVLFGKSLLKQQTK